MSDQPAKVAEHQPMCDHICLRDDGHLARGEPHFYGYELPSPRIVFVGDAPDPNLYDESELFVAGALSTMPPFDVHHPAYALPFARRALEALSEWSPSIDVSPHEDDRRAFLVAYPDGGGPPDLFWENPDGTINNRDFTNDFVSEDELRADAHIGGWYLRDLGMRPWHAHG